MFSHRLLFFSREATSETYGPRVSSHHICLYDLFFLAFIFRSIKPKNTKIPCCVLSLFYLAFDLSIYYNLPHVRLPILRRRTRKGLTTPLTRRVASICYLCAGVVYVVSGDSPTGSITLGSSLREIPTVAIRHHSFLFGEILT